MNWKKLNYQQKGAAIGFVVGVLLIFAHFLLHFLIEDINPKILNNSPIFAVFSILIDVPYVILMMPIGWVLWVGRLFGIPELSYVGYFITPLLLGSFIGWIYRKLKDE